VLFDLLPEKSVGEKADVAEQVVAVPVPVTTVAVVVPVVAAMTVFRIVDVPSGGGAAATAAIAPVAAGSSIFTNVSTSSRMGDSTPHSAIAAGESVPQHSSRCVSSVKRMSTMVNWYK
jgi:hypothetical protein